MVSTAGVKFPPLMLERMLLNYAKVVRALGDADRESTGRVGRHEFAKIFRQFAVDVDEGFVRVMDAFDRDGAGIDQKAFLEAASARLFPPRPAESMTLIIPPSKFFEEKGRGRGKDFPTLKTSWNNTYFQQIDATDEESEGKPVLHGILSGKFYTPPNSQFWQVPKLKKVSGLELDSSLNQPMSKSLMEGAYYNNPYENLPQTARSAKDFVQRNRAMTRSYSRLVTGARSAYASEGADRPAATPRTTGPFVKAARPASKSMRVMAQDLPTPRNADELQALWGRTLDPKFIASTLAWIKKAAPDELACFKSAVASNSTLVPSRSPVYPDRAYKGRPLTARSRLESGPHAAGEHNENPFLGKFVPKGEQPPRAREPPSARSYTVASTVHRVDASAVSAANAFVRSRQSPRVVNNGPERTLTHTPRVPTAPSSPKGNTASPRPPPIVVNSPARGPGPAIGIQGTKVQPMAPSTSSPRAGTPRARRMVTPAPTMPRTTSNDLHSTLQVLARGQTPRVRQCTFITVVGPVACACCLSAFPASVLHFPRPLSGFVMCSILHATGRSGLRYCELRLSSHEHAHVPGPKSDCRRAHRLLVCSLRAANHSRNYTESSLPVQMGRACYRRRRLIKLSPSLPPSLSSRSSLCLWCPPCTSGIFSPVAICHAVD